MKKMIKIWLCVGMLMTMAACGGSAKVDLKENIEIEYGSDLKVEDLTQQEGIQLKEIKEYDNKKLGEQKLTAIFVDADEKEIEQEITITVKDTQAPEIIFKSETVEITLGDSFDASANLESVKDPIDGDIKHSTDNTITQDGYVIAADIKSEAGEYTVAVTAFDKNGNKAEKSYKLVIKEKAEENNQPVASNQGGSQTQTPSHNNGTVSNSGGQANNGNSGGSTTTPPKKVCPNGNVPLDPNLPCDAWYSGDYDTCYKDANGNIVVFSTSQEAYTWAKNAWLSGEIKESYSNFVTTPISKNDGSHYYGVSFE